MGMAQRGHKKSSRNSSSRLTAPEDSLHDAKVVGEQRMWGRPLKPKGTPAASAWGRTSLASSLHGARPVRPGLKTSPEENGGASEMGHQSVVQGRQKGKQSSKITANSNMTDTSQYSAVPSVSREKKAGKTVPGQKAVQNPLAAELVVASLRTGRPVRQKRGKRPHSEQSWSVHHSSQGLHGPQEEPPLKRSRYLNSQSSIVETDKRPLGKKSFLRRAQEDMLIPGSTSTEGNSETRSGSKAGLSGVQDISRPLTRHSVHGASSTRLQNYRYCGLDSRPGLGLEENRGRHQLKSGSALGRVPQISSVTDAGGAASGTPTQRRKRGRGMAQPTRSEDIGFDPGQRKVLGLEGRRAVQSAGQTRGRRVKKAVHHGHPHALSGVKLGQGEKLTDGSGEVHPVASCSRNLTSVHDRNDRPKRNLSKRKKCECCQFDEEHPDASFSDSDSEFQKSVGKDDDRAWRSSIRPSGNKLKGAAGRGRKRRSVNKHRSRGTAKDHTFSSDHHQQSHAATYAYPVQLHTSFFRQELPLLGSLHCLGKEDVKAETLQQKSDGAVKDEAEFPFNPQVCSYNQNAKLPGEVAYMQDDFYVVVAESDDDEDGTDVSSKDMSVDGIKGSAESAPHKEIPDSKEAFTPQKEHKNQASSSSQREGCVGKVDNVTGTSFSVQNENKENAPVIAQSDELHSQSERVLKSALMAQKSLHHSLKSPEEGLGVKKEEPCFLTGQVSEKEAEVCNAKEEPDSRTEEGSHTLTAETEESSTTDTSDRQVEQSPQTAVIAQRTEAGQIQAEPSVSSPESDKVQPSSAGTEDNNRTQSSQESSAGHPAGDRKEQAQDTQHVTGVGDETSAMQGHTAAPDEIPDKDCVVKGKTEQGDSNQDGETTDVASDQGTACTVTPGEDPQQVSLEHRGGAAGESALVTSPNKIPQLITRQEYPAVEYPPREEALQMSSPAKDSAVVATGEKVELIFQREDPMQDDDAVIIPAENPVQNDCAVITPAENPSQNDTVITPTENPAQNDTVITPTENPVQNDTVITPTENPAQNDTVITPTENPAQNDTVITPTENPVQNDTVITPTENPAQNDTVITPTENPVQNDTVITPTDNPAQNDTVITPTDNPAQNDTVITPTENPAQNDTVITPTDNPAQNDTVITPTENPSQNDTVITPTENPAQNDTVITPTENPAQNDTVITPTENPVQNDTVITPTDNPVQNDTVITPTENPAQNDTVITPAENPAQNDTVITPTDNPAQNDTVITPTDNPAQNDTVITPAENPAQNDTVITPTDNPAQNDTVITPTDNPAQNDTVITPTENPAQNDTVITPTDNPAQNDTVITPTDNPVQNDKVSTFTEKPVQNDGAVIKPAENPAQDDAVLTPTENPVQNDGAVTTPTENPVQEVTVMARAENPVQADTVAAPSDQDQPDGPDHISAEEEKEVDTELCFHTSGHGDHQHRTNTATGVKGDLLVCGTTGGSSEENSQRDRMDCDTTAESFFKETYHVTAASKDGYHQGSQSVSKESHPVTAASKDGYHQSSESVSRLVL